MLPYPLIPCANLDHDAVKTRESNFVHVSASIFTPHHKECCIIVRRQCFIMAEKQAHSSVRDFHSCSSKLVCPVSLLSLLICTAALLRVEIINQRVHDVEDLVAGARQDQNVIKVFTDAKSFKHSERVESDGEMYHKITEERRDEEKGIALYRTVLPFLTVTKEIIVQCG